MSAATRMWITRPSARRHRPALLEAAGYHVAVLAQPNWKNTNDFKRFGRPNYGFLVSSGVIDSMVNHYTAAKRRRSSDVYTPGGRAARRPDRAVNVYCRLIREAYGDIPIAIGGVEASRDALPIMIIGTTRFAPAFWSIPAQIC